MKIIYQTGDLFDAPQKYILHGANAKGVMGSGVARIIREKYPLAFKEYAATFDRRGLVIGENIWVECGDKVIINSITQESYGRDPSVRYVSYEGIRQCMRGVNESDVVRSGGTPGDEHPLSIVEIAMPKIGAGLGNGDWDVIAQIIEEESTHFQPVVYVC